MKLGTMKDIVVEARVELGRCLLNLSDIESLGTGSIVGLDRLAGEPVDFILAGELVAKGEVVVIDESFGFRLTEWATEED
jgi:flagellar motor switch protein FliN